MSRKNSYFYKELLVYEFGPARIKPESLEIVQIVDDTNVTCDAVYLAMTALPSVAATKRAAILTTANMATITEIEYLSHNFEIIAMQFFG